MTIIKKIYQVLAFMLFYAVKLVQSNFFIAYDILTPRMHTSPGYAKIPLRTNTDIGILLFSNLLSMTPGTLTIDVLAEENVMLVHHLYGAGDNDTIEELERIQDKVIELTNKKKK